MWIRPPRPPPPQPLPTGSPCLSAPIPRDDPLHSKDPGCDDPAPGAGDAPARDPAAELSGCVKWFKADKGFGFVTADDGGKDVFVHKSMLRRCGLMQLRPGQRVRMRTAETDKGREATWLAVI